MKHKSKYIENDLKENSETDTETLSKLTSNISVYAAYVSS